ncbi:MAG: rod shape-determining protein MreD [Proteobacteria bacterium]|nr:rod shape-determining protein MreD [Pseudomonadota bacterium]
MKNFNSILFIIFTFLIAMILSILPLPTWATWFRPAWVVLVLMYWAIALPYQIGIGWAFGLGLALDILGGSVLGQHGLALCTVAYIGIKLHKQIRMYSFWQQSAAIFFIVMLYQFLIALVQGILGQAFSIYSFWMPAITSGLLWPWIFILLRDFRQRYVALT